MSIYFDNAATSDREKPPEVVEAVRRALTEHNANPGRSGHRAALEAAQIVLNAREGLRALMDAQSATQIAFGLNCTDALNLAIKGSLCRGRPPGRSPRCWSTIPCCGRCPRWRRRDASS